MLADSLDALKEPALGQAEEAVADLTFAEMEDLVEDLTKADKDPAAIEELIGRTAGNATVRLPVSTAEDAPTWKTRMEDEQSKIRVRGYNLANAP